MGPTKIINGVLTFFPYQDSKGIWTIFYGHNIEADPDMLPNLSVLMKTGGTEDQADATLDSDIQKATDNLFQALPWAESLDEARQSVLIDMSFNMGIMKLLQFNNTLLFIKEGNYEGAAERLEQSAWYSQVGARAVNLIRILRTGEM